MHQRSGELKNGAANIISALNLHVGEGSKFRTSLEDNYDQLMKNVETINNIIKEQGKYKGPACEVCSNCQCSHIKSLVMDWLERLSNSQPSLSLDIGFSYTLQLLVLTPW